MNNLEKSIRDFHEHVTELNLITDSLSATLDLSPKCPLYAAINAMIGGYIAAIDANHQIGGWLEWWWTECNMGANPMRASINGRPLCTIETIDDLVWLLLEDTAITSSEVRP